MVKGKMYHRIQDLRKKGYGKLAIGRELKLDPETVRKYFFMTAEAHRIYQTGHLFREKVIEPF